MNQSLILKRAPIGDYEDDYDVLKNGVVVGPSSSLMQSAAGASGHNGDTPRGMNHAGSRDDAVRKELAKEIRPASGPRLIAPIGLAEAVLYSPALLASVECSESAGPMIPSSTALVAAVVRTGRAVAGTVSGRRRPIAVAWRGLPIAIARRRRAVAGIGT